MFNEDVRSLEQDICEWIKEQKNKDRQSFYNIKNDDEIRPIFKDLIEGYQRDEKKLPQLIDAVFNVYIQNGWNNEDVWSINEASKKDWRRFLFEEINNDLRFNSMGVDNTLRRILEINMKSVLKENIRNTIIEVYKEKGQESDFYKKYMNYLISRLDN